MSKQYPLIDVLEVMPELKRSTYFYWVRKLRVENLDQELEEIVQSIYDEHDGNYGYRRICLELRNRGHVVNHKKVLRIMKTRGISCTKYQHKSRKYRSYKGTVGKVAPNLLRRRFTATMPREKICTDITEFKCKDGQKLYLSAFLDLFNGEIIAYKVGKRPTLDLVLDPLESITACLSGTKYRTTIHSDQGWHYQNVAWCDILQKHKILQSMSRKGNCLDNSPIENFFGLLKQEIYHGVTVRTDSELRAAISCYINYYNHKRIKQKLHGLSPVRFRIQSMQLTG
jgi:putative transposase